MPLPEDNFSLCEVESVGYNMKPNRKNATPITMRTAWFCSC